MRLVASILTTGVPAEDRQAVAVADGRLPAKPHRPLSICTDTSLAKPVTPATQTRNVSGGPHWPPNAEGILWFASHVFPMVRAKVSDAVLTVIGKTHLLA
jgi:hypothetical protein